ncbi:putative methyltransferase PMT15, partial [Bienertia sinuspersici]
RLWVSREGRIEGDGGREEREGGGGESVRREREVLVVVRREKEVMVRREREVVVSERFREERERERGDGEEREGGGGESLLAYLKVASFGAYLLSRNILTVSFAPKDTHEAQVQFALERGVPALIGIMATTRLPYPSKSFDMAHCSRCLIPWGRYVDRILRPGGYWILSGPPINWEAHWKGWGRSKEDLSSEQSTIEAVAKSLCWKKVRQRGDIAVWQKPTNHIHCKKNRRVFKKPQFCQAQDPDLAWYNKMEPCLTPLPPVSKITETAGGQLPKWPARLTAVPPRVYSGNLEGITPDVFTKDTTLWKKRLAYYKSLNNELNDAGRYRNILDMNAYLGGFAAALVNDPVWVMNVVPVEAKVNTLGVVFERGLIGTCKFEDILLEMDRILRPEGCVIFRDDIDVLVKVKNNIEEMQWNSVIFDHEDGPLQREKIMVAVKQYWTAPAPQQTAS